MNYLNDVITYVRRIVKTPSNQALTDDLIIDYINRFYTNDVPLRMQLFDLKTQYNLMLEPYIDSYNLPYYEVQTPQGGSAYNIAPYPMYQGLIPPGYVDGVQIPFMTSRDPFYKAYPQYTSNQNLVSGDGSSGPYTFSVGSFPLFRAHIDCIGKNYLNNNYTILGDTTVSGTKLVPLECINSQVYISTFNSNNVLLKVQDTGLTLYDTVGGDNNVGTLMQVTANGSRYDAGTVNYITGEITVFFQDLIPGTSAIRSDVVSFTAGWPRMLMYFNNVLTVRPIPDKPYLFSCDAYLTPAAFLNSSESLPFGYMSEYLARGAARKILSDTGDIEQFQFYEPIFREQELLVWRRSERNFTTNRVPTIFSQLNAQAPFNSSGQGGTN